MEVTGVYVGLVRQYYWVASAALVLPYLVIPTHRMLPVLLLYAKV
jgi:hypothetical protein